MLCYHILCLTNLLSVDSSVNRTQNARWPSRNTLKPANSTRVSLAIGWTWSNRLTRRRESMWRPCLFSNFSRTARGRARPSQPRNSMVYLPKPRVSDRCALLCVRLGTVREREIFSRHVRLEFIRQSVYLQITVETTRLKPDPTLEVELFAHVISYYKSSTHPGLTALCDILYGVFITSSHNHHGSHQHIRLSSTWQYYDQWWSGFSRVVSTVFTWTAEYKVLHGGHVTCGDYISAGRTIYVHKTVMRRMS